MAPRFVRMYHAGRGHALDDRLNYHFLVFGFGDFEYGDFLLDDGQPDLRVECRQYLSIFTLCLS